MKDTSLVYNPLGYGILTTPLQNLTFFNYIAKSKTAIKEALEYSVSNGLAKPAQSDKVKVAGATGTIQLPNGEYAVEFCGYFPPIIRNTVLSLPLIRQNYLQAVD